MKKQDPTVIFPAPVEMAEVLQSVGKSLLHLNLMVPELAL